MSALLQEVISPVLKVDYKDPQVAQKLCQSMRDIGFVVLKNHPVQIDLLKEVLKEWQDFFASEQKQDYLYNTENFMGFYPMGIENGKGYDLKNLMEYFHHTPLEKIPKGMSEKTNQLFNELLSLGDIVLGWLTDGLPQDNKPPLQELMAKDTHETVMRILHYPPVKPGEEAHVRNTDHEDINMITVLCSATAPGLQVKDKQGKWNAIACDPGEIVVNIGDMLQMLTQGYYCSSTHRVVIPEDKRDQPRYSFPLFIGAKKETELKPGFTAQDFFMERMRENGVI